MRFFSNDAKETNDDVPSRPDDESPVVPQQRIGSPWSDAPAENPADTAAGDHSDETDEPDDVRGPDDRVDTESADTRLGESERASDDLDRADSAHDDQVDLSLDERETPRDDDDVTSPDASVAAPDREVASSDGEAAVLDEEVSSPDAQVDDRADSETTDADPAIRDEGDFDEPVAVEPATDTPLDSAAEAESEADTDTPVAATPVEFGSDSTTYASTAVAEDTDTTDTDADTTPADATDGTAVVAAVPVAAAALSTPAEAEAGKPGSIAEKPVESLFGEDAAKGFQERWRDVQLRFVDSPKDAAAEAAALVDEAVDQLTANLKAQKDTLLSDTDDTEQLRLELRGYRDILNKVLSL